MMERAEQCTWGEGHPFKLKIGLNQGRAIAGVIGDHKPQFSLIGDTVNITSRICSNGEKGKVTISDSVYVHVKHLKDYRFDGGLVNLKGVA